MQPNAPTKPVMDVAAPKGSAPTPAAQAAPVAPAAPPAPTSSSELPVRPAPINQSAPQSAPQPEQPATPAHHAPTPQKAGSAALQQHHTPVGLITVTIFIMLVLSALAVTVYVTSKTA